MALAGAATAMFRRAFFGLLFVTHVESRRL
jgi:hypothetical protein